jgi:DNA-binding NarL/FixJ family response regulator
MATPYRAAVRLVPTDEEADQEHAGPVVIAITITVRQDSATSSAAAPDLASFADAGEVEPLTRRAREVLRGRVQGLTNREIAEALVVCAGTITFQVASMLGKLGVPNRHVAARHPRALALVRQTEAENAD